MDLDLVRRALDANGWFVVLDYLFHRAENEGKRALAVDLDRVLTELRIEIESLGGKPEYTR